MKNTKNIILLPFFVYSLFSKDGRLKTLNNVTPDPFRQSAVAKIGDNPFLLTNADILHHINLKKLPKDVKAAHLVGINNPNHNPQGDFSIKDNIVKVDEHKNDHTWTGVSIINPAIFKDNQFNKPIFNLWDSVLPNYIKEGVITGEVTTDPWIDVGTHERLKLANSAVSYTHLRAHET